MKSENTDTPQKADCPSASCSGSSELRFKEWVKRSNGRWDFLVNEAIMAMVKGPDQKEGYYFWEHWPWMGHYGRVGDLEHAKKCASAPWGGPSRVLRLTLKKKWFDMIASGEKREEYRVPTRWIVQRLKGKTYDVIEFKNGYGKNVPTLIVEYKADSYGPGKPEWGGTDEDVFILHLGQVISCQNASAMAPATLEADSGMDVMAGCPSASCSRANMDAENNSDDVLK